MAFRELRDVFLDEASEHVADAEAVLIELEHGARDPELLNRLFRAAHSIKGGSATVGLPAITRLTHALESVLDPLRDGSQELTAEFSSLVLRALDVVKSLLDAVRAGDVSSSGVDAVVRELEQALGTEGESAAGSVPARTSAGSRVFAYRVRFTPPPNLIERGVDPVMLLRNLLELGACEGVDLDASRLPALAELDPRACYLSWSLQILTERSASELRDVFAFLDDDAGLEIEPFAAANAGSTVAAGDATPALARILDRTPSAANRARRQSSLRVATSKLDELVNLVGELVIAQSMVRQALKEGSGNPLSRAREAVARMELSTKELQQHVMSIRMVPVAGIFERFPRMIRDLARTFEKKVALEVEGREAEIDKELAEQIVDPLMHLIRNAVDHGIETPARRVAQGKPETGTVSLRAFHDGGGVTIEVSDDGRGLDTQRIREKAVELGLIRPGDDLTDGAIHELIFAPGFSTAASVTDVSGRGVGMDVVRSNIRGLGGSVTLASTRGAGTCFRIRLPLTLAITDGLLLRVGRETFIVPLLSVVESFRPRPEQLRTVLGSGEIVCVRGEAIPLVRLGDVLGSTPDRADVARSLVVLVEARRTKLGIVVDELLEQAQVVVKSLEAHYRRVEGVMGATILGDGRVALILDVEGIARRALGSGQGAPASAAPDAGAQERGRGIEHRAT